MSTIFDKKAISGNYSLTSTSAASYTLLQNSAMRIEYTRSANSTSTYISAKFCILTVEDIKVFAGVYTDENDNEVTLIQIPLVGQTITDLVTQINRYADTFAEVVNNLGFVNAATLSDTAFTVSNGSWIYFTAIDATANSVFAQLQSDLRFYLTSAEPLVEQKNLTQSVGGFVSNTQVCGGAILFESLSVYDKILVVSESSLSSDYTLLDLQKNKYLQINDEIVAVDKWVGLSAYLSHRNVFDTPLRMHPKGSIVREIIKNNFFDTNISTQSKQYRCLAIKNINSSNEVKDLRLYFNIGSRNNLSEIKVALEVPRSDYYSGISSTTGITSFSVYNLMNEYADDHFKGAPIKFTSGSNVNQTRIVKQFVGSTGTIVLDQRLPSNIAVGDNFYIDSSPSTRIKSSAAKPVSSAITEFFNPSAFDNSIPINIAGNRVGGNSLKPNEVIYVWFERSITAANDEYDNNRLALSLSFSRV